MTESITEAARREAEERIHHLPYGTIRTGYKAGFRHGAEWERDREHAEEGVEALVDDIIHWDDTTATDGPCDGPMTTDPFTEAARAYARKRAEVFRLREYQTDRLLPEWSVYVFPADIPPLRKVPLADRYDDYYISTDDFPTHAAALAHALAEVGLTEKNRDPR